MSSFVVEPVFNSLLVVLAIGLSAAAITLGIRPAGGSLTPRRARALMLLRLTALVVLLLGLLRPAIVRTDARPAPATLAVLIDRSRSMTLSDGEGRSRWETQRAALLRLQPELESLDRQLEIQYFAYGDQVERVEAGSLKTLLEGEPDRPRTDVGAALRAALSGASGRPLAGVILSGDGTTTVAQSNPAAIARTLASLEVPLWTVPIGPRVDASQSRDVAIEELPESFHVFAKNLFRITATVRSRGMAGRDIAVHVNLIDADDQSREIATRTISPAAADDASPLDVELAAPPPGSYRLEIVADPHPGETLTENNRQTAFLDVREGGGRILYIEGEKRYEQLFLRRAINESPDLELDYAVFDRSTQSRWPVDLGDATNPGRYDAYVLGDIDASALGEENLTAIAERVADGSGLLMIGGLQTFDVGGYADSPLAAVLPIRMDTSLRTPIGQDPPASAMIEGPVLVEPLRPHAITRLSNSGASEDVWRELKPLLGANRFGAPKVAPGVDVLLESSEEDPLLVVGEYGRGRTAAFAGDSTWQWWLQGRQEAHQRFWRQLMLWLLARDAPQSDQVWVRMETRRFDRDQPSPFTAGVQFLEPPEAPFDLAAEVVSEDGTAIQVPVVAEAVAEGDAMGIDQPLISGQIPDLPGGFYTLRISDRAGGDGAPEPAELLFQVVEIDAELSRPIAEITHMEQLAALTEGAGGRAFRPEAVDELIDTIARLRHSAVLPIVEKYRLGDGPLSGWLMMIGFAALLSTEWFFRKRWGLV